MQIIDRELSNAMSEMPRNTVGEKRHDSYWQTHDRQQPKYKQPTTKERCIAYLRDLDSGTEKTTEQLMEEDFPLEATQTP
jgi:hypothetical protein